MAIVVPFLMAAAGASTMTAVITSVAFAVTGINAKIDKAAANVFGEDLVKVANLAGMAYGAFNGGFSLGDTANTAQQGFRAAEIAAENSAGLAGAAPDIGTMMSSGIDSMSMADKATMGVDMPGAQSMNLQDLGNVNAPNAMASNAPKALSGNAPQSTRIDSLAGNNASTYDATNSGNAIDPSATAAVTNPAIPTNASAAQATQATPGGGFLSNLQKMVIDPKTGTLTDGALKLGGQVLTGAAGAYSASAARQQAQAQYEQEAARRDRLANLGAAGWRQTA